MSNHTSLSGTVPPVAPGQVVRTAELLAQFRAMAQDDPRRQQTLISVLLSINCVASGFGWTG